jgi:hypothetical protein
MSCEWEQIRGTGRIEPAIFRCSVSRNEDVLDCEECCPKCGCECEEDEEEIFTYSSETPGMGTYYGSEEKGGT